MYRTVLLNLPTTVRSFVMHDPDCDTIVINARLPHDVQKECFIHERNHIEQADFDCGNVDLVECLAHRKAAV